MECSRSGTICEIKNRRQANFEIQILTDLTPSPK